MNSLFNTVMNTHTDVQAFFTTRHGGFSSFPYASLNFGFHVGDDPLIVAQNHQLLSQKFPMKHVVFMQQVHSSHIVVIDEKFDLTTQPPCDALITNLPHIALMVMTADCVPVLLYDAKEKVIGAVHAGRAGAFQGIVPKTLAQMNQYFGTKTDNVYVAIGASIGGCCYELSSDLLDEAVSLGFLSAVDKKRKTLDVATIIDNQLYQSGVPKNHIQQDKRCTACETQEFFSYRAEGKTGRQAGVIMLTPDKF